MSSLGKFVFGCALGAFYTFVAWRLWDWFAVPVGAPHVTYAHAYGLYALATSVLIWSFHADINQKDTDYTALALAKAMVSAIILFEGWLAHLVMGIGG